MTHTVRNRAGAKIVSKRRLASAHSPAQLSLVIGQIYDAATDPSLWPSALRSVLQFVGNSGTHLWLMDRNTRLVSHSIHVGMPDQLMKEYNGDIIKECPRYAHACAYPDRTLLYDYQHIDERDIDSNEYYHWLQTTGDTIRYYLGGRIRTISGAEGFQSLAFRKSEGHANREHIERFSILLPHVQRAIDIGQQLGTWRYLADVTADVLDRLSHGVILLDERQQVLKVNVWAEKFLRGTRQLSVRQGTFFAREPRIHCELQKLIAKCVDTSQADGTSVGGLIKIPYGQTGATVHVLVCPMRMASGTFDVRPPAAVVFLHDPMAAMKIDEQAIRSGFGLTAAEGRLAAMLVAGSSMQEVGAQLGLSPNTLRTQLKNVFAKTGVNRQADLLRALLPLCQQVR